MATGHLNPGYGGTVSGFRRIRSACYPGTLPSGQMIRDYHYQPADNDSLDAIRRRAKEAWSKPDTRETSYQDHFHDRNDEMQEYTQNRPTSATRKNKPHPPL